MRLGSIDRKGRSRSLPVVVVPTIGKAFDPSISKAMISSGNLLASTPVSESTEGEQKEETRMFKFGELQVELTREKAYIGAVIGFVYGSVVYKQAQRHHRRGLAKLQGIKDQSEPKVKRISIAVFVGSSQVDWGESTMIEAERLLL
ncbi:hypothetical protein L2E82_13189 [Cichorium intybus]|uniref:Uncharacterized protein n=1 Tax=Cichorium intybus TaxID=13427 RepID=A0ACB9GIT4_CICIN|nr:hypothetical protein L2E82_13189 [Cichorium intybus]